MNIYDIIACPICKTDLMRIENYLICSQCGKKYPIKNDVPILLPNWEDSNVQHEGELTLRDGYDPWIHRTIIESLTDDQIAIDAGCGNMILDDPRIIRMDVKLTPYVDIVGDLHHLPLKPASIDFIFALAVFEHLYNPFMVSNEIYNVLKSGGYVYAESNFVFPYHGYPYHYFNMSIHGLKQVFSQFKELKIGVAPYQMPSFAIESLLSTYLAMFKIENNDDTEFVNSVQKVLKYPLRVYDSKFLQNDAFRIAAGVYYLGIKPNGDFNIPAMVLDKLKNIPAVIEMGDQKIINSVANSNIIRQLKTKNIIREFMRKLMRR